MINVCVPVIKRYDLLREMLLSLQWSTPQPDGVYVIDNGNDKDKMDAAVNDVNLLCDIVVWPSERPLSVAASWNWFLMSVPEDRVIVNDDVTFAPESLSKLVAPDADLVWAAGCGFSCFVLRDSCVKKVGLFDEAISPGYGYYEDEDYLQRLDGRGTREPIARATNVECGVTHLKSQSLPDSIKGMQEHHRRFKIAQYNYMKKWGLASL
jgi:hypothetical protein